MTRWLDPPQTDTSPLSTLDLPLLLKQTLIRRGIATPDSARAFLHPEETPSTPFPEIENAVEIIYQAIQRKDRICVWGDFDVDGQTSTALLVQTLQSLGADVVYYIPIRGKESHGVHIESLAPIIDGGIKLLITCDTGITAHDAIDYANSRGVNVVLTDHHDVGETLPNAKAIINPKLLPQGHPLKNLAGVGVAYKLAEALLRSDDFSRQKTATEVATTTSEDLLDLVALGLIADVALLQSETRSLAQRGIRQLRKTNRLGLKVMAELSNTQLESLTEETIGFTFAPRLNALGRLSDANPAVELLITNNPARARVLAAQIEGLNAQRRLLTSQVTEAAEVQLREHPELLNEPAIVLSHPNWPGGVVGIVANRLVDRYHKPALLLTESDDGILRGSARSIEGLHITEAISSQKNSLLNFGGHPMAAGLSLQKENLTSFRRGLGRAIEKQLGEIIREDPTLQIDSWLGLDEINLELADAIELLAPFGAGNPKLTFASRGITLKSIAEVGKTKEHLRLAVEDENGNVQSILWWGGAGEELPETGTQIDIAYSVRASTFRGEKQVNATFEEFRIVESKAIEIKERRLEIRDWRLESGKWKELENVLTWAEGADKAKGKSRYELHPADELVIYTTPASPADLRAVLEIVKPNIVHVIGVSPAKEKTDEFLARLAGMAKFAINNKGGKVSVNELAVATTQRVNAVRVGLEWLSAGGHVTAVPEEDAVLLSAGNGEANQYLQKELFVAVRGILDETTAFRDYFSRADLKQFFSDL
ncbi:MAG: single-stranded-DNA-specific exonuclease RecJ [Anaerolineae bacterium]|jgi:single-stranded-DNA-specific exonuclease|nr:single-stranded-DNA-specific exonuclease RecJ [Anaerolineae bacterium]MBL8106557.1 single-stranded-DNA-specific exonuclease RecJ [Anaerolineales bacterium]